MPARPRCFPLSLYLLTVCVGLSAATAHAQVGRLAYPWQYLQGTDNKLHSLSDYRKSKFVVVAFLCNKCPCVKGYESRFKKINEVYGKLGVRFVGINCSTGPLETMDEMKRRAKAGGYNFDYLRDPSQHTGRGFHATSTPHCFILDEKRTVVYAGAFDDNRNENSVTRHYVTDALNALLAGRPVPEPTTRQFGCAITYKR